MDRLSDTALLAMSAFDDGYGAWGEAETSIAGACALPKVGASAIRGGTDDIDGDGTRDLVVIRDLGTGAERIPRPQVYSSLDLDALNLDQGAALSILALSDETYSVTSGADIDGGITDLAVASRTYTAGDWSDQDVVFFGPLAGVRDQGQLSYSDGRGVGAGTTVDLGDLDEDGGADLGFGSLHDTSDGGSAAELSIYLGLGD